MAPEHNENFIVHWYGPAHQSPPDDTNLLEQGRLVLTAATEVEEWHHVRDPLTKSTHFQFSGNCFEYAPTPPAVDTSLERSPLLRDWGSDILETEIFRLEYLEDFLSTEFFLSSQPAPSAVIKLEDNPDSYALTTLPETVRKQENEGNRETDFDDIAKHRCADIETGLLRTLIERPHLYTSPRISTSNPSVELMNPDPMFFRGASPMVVAPNTMDRVWDIFADPFARCTWVIPIRGKSPWPDSFSAMLLKQSKSTSVEVDKENPDPDVPSVIFWTKGAVQALWQFLLQVREAQRLGPIGLSFHYAAATKAEIKVAAPTTNNATTAITTLKSQRRSGAPTILDLDHIKVYHDARYAVHLRNVFHAWSYQYDEDSSGAGHETPTATMDGIEHRTVVKRKVRMLKGVRLALLDERSKVILIC